WPCKGSNRSGAAKRALRDRIVIPLSCADRRPVPAGCCRPPPRRVSRRVSPIPAVKTMPSSLPGAPASDPTLRTMAQSGAGIPRRSRAVRRRAARSSTPILPIDPFDAIGLEIGVDGLADGREEELVAEAFIESKPLQLVLDRIFQLGKAHLDAG